MPTRNNLGILFKGPADQCRAFLFYLDLQTAARNPTGASGELGGQENFKRGRNLNDLVDLCFLRWVLFKSRVGIKKKNVPHQGRGTLLGLVPELG